MSEVDEAIKLAGIIRDERGVKSKLVSTYWRYCYWLTYYMERFFSPKISAENEGCVVLNFGCGNNYKSAAINSDLFSFHRFIKRKKRPDIYWTGVSEAHELNAHFDGIVCEHVIEHLWPDDLISIFKNFQQVLKKDSYIVISFPYVSNVMKNPDLQGYSSKIVALNSVIYRHGHRFMYDVSLATALLAKAGFSGVREAVFEELPFVEFLDEGRRRESVYIVGVA
jgi:SAM-dependent methyltransferase